MEQSASTALDASFTGWSGDAEGGQTRGRVHAPPHLAGPSPSPKTNVPGVTRPPVAAAAEADDDDPKATFSPIPLPSFERTSEWAKRGWDFERSLEENMKNLVVDPTGAGPFWASGVIEGDAVFDNPLAEVEGAGETGEGAGDSPWSAPSPVALPPITGDMQYNFAFDFDAPQSDDEESTQMQQLQMQMRMRDELSMKRQQAVHMRHLQQQQQQRGQPVQGALDAAYRRVLEECAALEDAVTTLEAQTSPNPPDSLGELGAGRSTLTPPGAAGEGLASRLMDVDSRTGTMLAQMKEETDALRAELGAAARGQPRQPTR